MVVMWIDIIENCPVGESYTSLMAEDAALITPTGDNHDNEGDFELAFTGDHYQGDKFDIYKQRSNSLSNNNGDIPVDNQTQTDLDGVGERDASSRNVLFYDHSLRYGWLCLSGQMLQLFNQPRYFLVWVCVSGAAQGLIRTGITFTVLTSIERQFGFKSSELAFFSVIYDITYGVCTIFVGYVGHKHKPRYIGWGCFIMALGSATSAIPKFLIGPYVAGVEHSSDFCRLGNFTIPTKQCVGSKVWYYQFIFILGNILLGIGATPLYTLAPAHLDEVTERGQGSFYMGIFYSFCAVGPALGFMIGKPVLNTYVDIKQPFNSTLVPSDTNWVGAWWLGYLIGACLLLLPAIPMLGFPRTFPNTETLRVEKLGLEDTVEENKNLKHDLKSVWPAMKALLKNSSFIFLSLAIAAEGIATGGFATFLPKFVETQYHLTASNSALYTGIIVIPGAAGGIFCGGYLGKRYKWNCKQILRFSTIMSFLATLCTVFILVGCEGRQVVGQTSNGTSFINSCNHGCHCSTEFYKPICSIQDQKTYYSPCYAGCGKGDYSSKDFYNCTCFSSNIRHAIDGPCTSKCYLFPVFVVGGFLLMFFTFLNNVPMLNAVFRVVHDGQGSFAMGFQQIIVRLVGFIPAPIIFGHVIDKSCKLWKRDQCTGKTTSCLEYNHLKFRHYMFALAAITKTMSVILIIIARKSYRLPVKSPTTGDQNITSPVCEPIESENYTATSRGNVENGSDVAIGTELRDI